MYRAKSKEGVRRVSPPQPSYMNDAQIASYLSDLRSNRPARPNGSRPLPSRASTSTPNLHDDLPPRAQSVLATSRPIDLIKEEEPNPRSASALSHRRETSDASSNGPNGRPLVHEPSVFSRQTFSPAPSFAPSTTGPGGRYRESGQRWMEKQEARSIRDAMEEMDLQDEERRVHTAAQDEATELVWQHQNPGRMLKNPNAPYQNPDFNSSNRYRQHLERGSHARSQSFGTSTRSSDSCRSSSNSSSGSRPGRISLDRDRVGSPTEASKSAVPGDKPDITAQKSSGLRKKPKVNFALPSEERPDFTRPSSGQGKRTVSNDSSKGVFRNPEDFIYEEPDRSDEEAKMKQDLDDSSVAALTVKPRNSLPRGARPLPERSSTVPVAIKDRIDRFEIYKNPPTQSRNPSYQVNRETPPPVKEDSPEPVRMKDGLEIRSDDIRAATGMRLKDRSTRLPMPSAVSDRPGRPIVSFDPGWKAKEEANKQKALEDIRREASRRSLSSTPPVQNRSSPSPANVPSINVSDAPVVPTINLPGDDDVKPVIMVDNSPCPISAMEPQDQQSRRPLPDPASFRGKPQPSPARSSTTPSKGSWYTPYTRSGVPTATCTSCGLPISGRIVTAAGSRFHPECFSCFHCSTALECVAFYQEPEAKRAERLASTENPEEDAESLRFYCHLDFHELFSPRCKSCKTPIEGEVVVACGAEWHVGHFFCAECGDPFGPTKPFVERSGFAWCLECHSKRTASRCLGCKQPVLDELVVSAIGGQWHDKCFVCSECSGGFGPDGRFFVKEGPPRRTAKGRIIGGPVEYPVCEGCESRRLKA